MLSIISLLLIGDASAGSARSGFGIGAVVDLENVLGVERSFGTYRIDARYRFGETNLLLRHSKLVSFP